jgi:hypothetical protein
MHVPAGLAKHTTTYVAHIGCRRVLRRKEAARNDKRLSRGGGGAPRLEAFAAEHRTALRRLERDGSLFAAMRASCAGLNLLIIVGWSRAHRGGAFRLAWLAAFRFVLELLIVEE